MFYRIWNITKLVYLYILYWTVGIDDEEFFILKANYCVEIGWFKAAIQSYTKALNETDDPRILSSIGWCYAELGMNEKSAENYRLAFEKNNAPEFAIGLAFAEYGVGNLTEFIKIYEKIKNTKLEVPPEFNEQLQKLHKLGENVSEVSIIKNETS